MKYKILILYIFIICNNVFSQDLKVDILQNNLGINYKIRDFVVQTKLSNNISGEKYIGSFFLFDNWENNCIIQINEKEFRLNNVNFNIQNNEFMSEIGKDSVFAVLPRYINLIIINNKKFKYHFYKGENKFFEILFESKKKLSIFKGYHIRIIPKSDIGMLNRPYDEIRKEEKFYILNGAIIIGLKLKKKDILKYMDRDKQNTIINYVKERKLSYKREKDVVLIFKYYDTI